MKPNIIRTIKEKVKGIAWLRNRRYRQYDRQVKPLIDAEIQKVVSQDPVGLFRFIEIETLNRCNGGCSFCPVNKNSDPREYALMSKEMFTSIVEQLKEMEYTGIVDLFANNEPLLDKRIYDFAAQVREALPKAYIVMYTNGTLLTIEKFQRLAPSLNFIQIDNYSDELKLHDNIAELQAHVEANPISHLSFNVRVRKETEVLTTRGGNAPNKVEIPKLESSCVLPFQQMVIRSDGKASLCCNDALGKMTLGDLSKQTLLEIWRGKAYENIRKQLMQSRQKIPMCAECDSFLGEVPYPDKKLN